MAGDDDAGGPGNAEAEDRSEPDTEHDVDASSTPDEDEIVAARTERNRSMVAHGRRIGGAPGAMMAGAMIAIRDIYEPPKDDQVVAVSESPDEPHDVDRDGVTLTPGDVGGANDVEVAAQPRRQPVESARGRRRPRR